MRSAFSVDRLVQTNFHWKQTFFRSTRRSEAPMDPECRYEPEGHVIARFEIRPPRPFRSTIFELSKALPANVFFKMYYYPSGRNEPCPEDPTAEMGIIVTDFGSFSTLHCHLQCRITNAVSETVHLGDRQACTFGRDTKQRWTYCIPRSELEAAQRDSDYIFAEIRVETALPETRVSRSLSPVQRRIEASLLSSPEQPEQLEAPPLPVAEDGTATFLFPVENVEQQHESDFRVRFEGISFMLRFLPNSWGDATFEFFARHFAARRRVPLEFEWSLQNADRVTKFRHCEVVELADCECKAQRKPNCNCSHTKVHVLFSVPKKPLRSFAGGKAVCLTLKLRRLEESGEEDAPKSSPFSGLVLPIERAAVSATPPATPNGLPPVQLKLLNGKEEPSSRPSSATPRPSSAANGTKKTRAVDRKIPPLSPPKPAEIEIIVLSDDSDVEEERPNANAVANGAEVQEQPQNGQPEETAGEAPPEDVRVEEIEVETSPIVLDAPEPAESSAPNDQPPALEAEPQQADVQQEGKSQTETAKDRSPSPPESPPRLHRSNSTDDAESGDSDVSIPSSSEDDEEDAPAATPSTAAPSDRPPKRSHSPKDGEEEATKKRRKRDLLKLLVDDAEFTVEREPLVASSGYFARAVAENVGATEFQLNGIHAPVLAAIVKWVERREVNRLDKVAQELYVMARVLEIPSLLEKCRDSIKLTCRFKNFAQSLIFAVEHEDPELIRAMAFLWRTPERLLPVLVSDEFTKVLAERPLFMAEIFKAMNAK
ncbi:hypothetical protein M3Y99_01976600 [Aphelenchoides fujianensis]|nr:hypothetical protein M3Y99_01976600 [Aphelenchoides fujianensis]